MKRSRSPSNDTNDDKRSRTTTTTTAFTRYLNWQNSGGNRPITPQPNVKTNTSEPAPYPKALSLIDSPSRPGNASEQSNRPKTHLRDRIVEKIQLLCTTSEQRQHFFHDLLNTTQTTTDTRHTSYSPPRTTSNYDIKNELGKGTYGVVSRAMCNQGSHCIANGTEVALKRIEFDLKKGWRDGLPTSAMREIKILLKVKHQNLVRLYEVIGEEKGRGSGDPLKNSSSSSSSSSTSSKEDER